MKLEYKEEMFFPMDDDLNGENKPKENKSQRPAYVATTSTNTTPPTQTFFKFSFEGKKEKKSFKPLIKSEERPKQSTSLPEKKATQVYAQPKSFETFTNCDDLQFQFDEVVYAEQADVTADKLLEPEQPVVPPIDLKHIEIDCDDSVIVVGSERYDDLPKSQPKENSDIVGLASSFLSKDIFTGPRLSSMIEATPIEEPLELFTKSL